jgi:hypothetical protein
MIRLLRRRWNQGVETSSVVPLKSGTLNKNPLTRHLPSLSRFAGSLGGVPGYFQSRLTALG